MMIYMCIKYIYIHMCVCANKVHIMYASLHSLDVLKRASIVFTFQNERYQVELGAPYHIYSGVQLG